MAIPGAERAALTVDLDGAQSSDPEGDSLTYSWTFGHGMGATGAKVNHAYAVPGTYEVSLTVSDQLGALASTSTMVRVPNTGSITILFPLIRQ